MVQDIDDFVEGNGFDEEADVIPLVGPVAESAIPVPRTLGKLWKSRIEDAKNVYEMEHTLWENGYHRYRRVSEAGVLFADTSRQYADSFDSAVDENLVRQNIKTTMRDAYMQNPHIEFTATENADKELPEVLEKGINFIIQKETHPGVNLRPKARRWILHGQLTNHGVIRLDYQPKEGSLEEASAFVVDIERRIEEAKTSKEVQELYQELERAYEELPIAAPKGMQLTNVLPHRIFVDPECSLTDLSDADWLAEEVDLDRDYIRKTFYQETEDGMVYRQDTGVVVGQDHYDESSSVATDVVNKIMESSSDERIDVNAKNKQCCYYIYDKLMRRIYLFSDENWKTPLWVWEDNLELSRFFRHFILSFTETIDGIVQAGEVSQYTGLEDEINRVNRKISEIRGSVFGTILFNSNTIKEKEAKKLVKILKNPNEFESIGLDIPPDVDVSKAMQAFAPPAMQYRELFDTRNLRTAVDRVAETSEIERGGEFRTNTTNEAVSAYANLKQQKIDVLVGSIEEAMTSLAWAMSEIFISKYSQDDVTQLLGPDWAQKFKQMPVAEFNRECRLVVAPGSIQKPTTQHKKEEALNIAQAIGQMGQAAPMTMLRIMIRLFEKAFSGMFVSEKDWKSLEQEGQANMTKGQSVNDNGGPRPANGAGQARLPVQRR